MPNSSPDKPLFTFAVVTDTHLNQGETECNSPFEVNRLANARMRHVVQDLNARELAFVIHLGDLLHPVPAIPHLYERAAEQFQSQIETLRHPIYLVPGNHDVGDKPIEWGPAGVVREEFLALWRKHFGANYQSFTQGDCHFVLIDAQIINSGLAAEAEQARWLENELRQNADKRLFVNSHYPPFLTTQDEDEHYDNLGEPGRSWLLKLLEQHKVEAFFAGHVHNFWYYQHAATACYLLPSTAFVRQDYAEMYRAQPPVEMESGRNDAAKLGYFLIHVYQHGHICEVVRTFGKTAAPDSTIATLPRSIAPVHPSTSALTRFGFDMRQNWLELVEIPPSGGLDEFDRKRVRNDYPLLALMDMGISRVRIPAQDLLNPEHRERLAQCSTQGIRFTLFSFGEPSSDLRHAISEFADLIDAWELAGAWSGLGDCVNAVRELAGNAGIALYVSKLRSKDEMERGGEKYYHMINHGFGPEDTEQLETVGTMPGVAGAVFRIAGEADPWLCARDIASVCEAQGLLASMHIRMSRGNPGSRQDDDVWVSNRVLASAMASVAHENVNTFIDAFADIDRGYFARHGVVDRLHNPRLAYHTLRSLNAALSRTVDLERCTSAEVATPTLVTTAGERISLCDEATADATRIVELKSGIDIESPPFPADLAAPLLLYADR